MAAPPAAAARSPDGGRTAREAAPACAARRARTSRGETARRSTLPRRDDRGEALAVLGGADHVGGDPRAGPRASARGRRRSRRRAGRRSAATARSKRTSFQPMCGTRSPPPRSGVTSPRDQAQAGGAARARRSARTAAACPGRCRAAACRAATRSPTASSSPSSRRLRHRLRERPDARERRAPSARRSSIGVAGDLRRGRRRAPAPSAPSAGCPSRNRPRRARRAQQRPLGAGYPALGGVDRHRRAQRPGERLERRLDHVMDIGAGLDREVEGQLGVGRQGAEELLGQLVVEVADRARRQLGVEHRQAAAGDVDRARGAGLVHRHVAWP